MTFVQSELSLKKTEKLTQQIDSWAVAHLAHHVLLRTLMQSINWHSIRRVHQGHTCKYYRQGNWHFAEVSGTHHTQRHSAKVPEETILAWSGIQQSITDQAINQRRNRLNACVKANGKHFEHLL